MPERLEFWHFQRVKVGELFSRVYLYKTWVFGMFVPAYTSIKGSWGTLPGIGDRGRGGGRHPRELSANFVNPPLPPPLKKQVLFGVPPSSPC